MDSRRRSASATVLAIFAIAVACAGSASAADVTATTVAPTVVTGTPPFTVTYSFELHTAALAEQPTFTVDGPELPSATLTGPGSISATSFETSSQVRGCAGGRGVVTSNGDYTARFGLALPPESVNTLVVTAIRKTPLELDGPFGYSFGLGADFLTTNPIAAADPQLNVRRTVPLSITTGATSIKRGSAILLRGRTTSLLAGAHLLLRYTAKWPARWQRLALVTVGKSGRFAYRWRARTRGVYTVAPYYVSHDPRFATSAAACGATFTVR